MSKTKTSRTYALRKKRTPQYSEQEAEKADLKWSTQEISDLTKGILTHGHLSERVLDEIPKKDWESYRKMFRQAAGIAIEEKRSKLPRHVHYLNSWLIKAEGTNLSSHKKATGPLDVAAILKLLSIDGLLENHPLPENANGVDFGACYRLMHQAVLGYPLQPVNEPTLNLFYELLGEISQDVKRNRRYMEKVQNDLTNPNKSTSSVPSRLPEKQIKSYSRKKPLQQPISGANNISDEVDNLFLGNSYNPLQVPVELLHKSQIEDKTSTSVSTHFID